MGDLSKQFGRDTIKKTFRLYEVLSNQTEILYLIEEKVGKEIYIQNRIGGNHDGPPIISEIADQSFIKGWRILFNTLGELEDFRKVLGGLEDKKLLEKTEFKNIKKRFLKSGRTLYLYNSDNEKFIQNSLDNHPYLYAELESGEVK